MALISNKDRPKQNVVYSSALRPAGKATASWHGIPITGEQDSTKLPTCRHRARKLRPLRVHCRPVQVHFPPPQYIHFLFLFVGPLVFPCTAPVPFFRSFPIPVAIYAFQTQRDPVKMKTAAKAYKSSTLPDNTNAKRSAGNHIDYRKPHADLATLKEGSRSNTLAICGWRGQESVTVAGAEGVVWHTSSGE